MITIGSKSRYGITAVLALTGQYGKGLVQIKELAESGKIPRQYLAQILHTLLNAGIIQSVRGKHGGYKLSKAPSEITALQVIEALEGGILFGVELDGDCCVMQDLFDETEKKMKESLSVSLEELYQRRQSNPKNVMYHI